MIKKKYITSVLFIVLAFTVSGQEKKTVEGQIYETALSETNAYGEALSNCYITIHVPDSIDVPLVRVTVSRNRGKKTREDLFFFRPNEKTDKGYSFERHNGVLSLNPIPKASKAKVRIDLILPKVEGKKRDKIAVKMKNK